MCSHIILYFTTWCDVYWIWFSRSFQGLKLSTKYNLRSLEFCEAWWCFVSYLPLLVWHSTYWVYCQVFKILGGKNNFWSCVSHVDLKSPPPPKPLFVSAPVLVLLKEKHSSQNLILRWMLGKILTELRVFTVRGHNSGPWSNWIVWTVPLYVFSYSDLWWYFWKVAIYLLFYPLYRGSPRIYFPYNFT